MNDKELLDEFTDVRSSPSGLVLRVRQITWPHPHEPKTRWHAVTRLPVGTSPTDIDAARQRLLLDPKYFRVCTECHQWKPSGWMHDDAICQSCAERNHGVMH